MDFRSRPVLCQPKQLRCHNVCPFLVNLLFIALCHLRRWKDQSKIKEQQQQRERKKKLKTKNRSFTRFHRAPNNIFIWSLKITWNCGTILQNCCCSKSSAIRSGEILLLWQNFPSLILYYNYNILYSILYSTI